jgi:NAD(P)-dependent dehydrogenase (short-subunit alcohol dehydrogenase family)
MKETLRKTKSSKTDSSNDFDVTSTITTQSSESHSPNPWASESSSAVVGGEAISRQVSKASKSPAASSPDRAVAQSQSPPRSVSRLEVPTENGNGVAADDPTKPTRRRKTITKTPHTFELAADLNPVKPKDPPSPEPQRQDAPPVMSPAPKKKKRVSQVAPPDSSQPSSIATNSVPAIYQSSPPTSPKPVTAAPSTPKQVASIAAPSPSPASPKQHAAPVLQTGPPLSPKQSSTTVAPVNPFTATRPKKSLSTSSPLAVANPCRFTPPALPKEEFHGKVIVITNGASLVGQSLIRQLHQAGCRVIFGDTNGDQSRKLISSLGPPHVVHFNKCDMTRYSDMLDLFKLATTMYGRVDHAIYNVGDDGGQAATVGEAEKGWFDDRTGINKTSRMALNEVEREPFDLGDILAASVRFTRIALAYLKYSPKSKPSKKTPINPYSTPQPEPKSNAAKDDRSLTFVTSIAAFKETPLLPIYQATQHSILGLLRSLRSTIDPDPERDGVRINAVATNIMVPRAVAQSGGRMSVQLPPDRPEDVARVVAGVVATNSSTPGIGDNESSITNGGGIWYEKGFERGMREKYLHGRVIYTVGGDAWDIQEGLDRSESVWVGGKSSEALARGMAGLGLAAKNAGSESSWILDLV